MTDRIAIATISSANYWPYTAVLLESLNRFCPRWKIYVLGLDELPASGLSANVEVLRPEEVWGGESEACRLRLNLFEWACASKAKLLRYLLDDGGATVAVYVDSDVEFFAPPDSIFATPAAIVLTPNVAATGECASAEWEREHLRYGAYNGGFLAVRNSDGGRSFLDWWDQRITRYCCADPLLDIFSDQRWLDLVPGLFPDVIVDRNPSLNVATWNLRGRDLRSVDGHFTVGGQPLCFFHYHRVRLGMDVDTYLAEVDFHPAACELVRAYLAKAGRHASAGCTEPGGPGRPDRGAVVPPLVYRAVRDSMAEGSLSLDPSDVSYGPLEQVRVASLAPGRLRARLRVLAYHFAHAKLTAEPGSSIHRYEASRWYRAWIDLWYFWQAPRQAQLPVNWISGSRQVLRGRKMLTAIVRSMRLG